MKKILYVHNLRSRTREIFDKIASEALDRGELVATSYMKGVVTVIENGEVVEYHIRCLDDDRDYSKVAGTSVNQVIYDESSTFSDELIKLVKTRERL